MKNKFNNLRANTAQQPLKQQYKAPVLQHFGSVTDLTNSAVGSCQDDGNNCATAGPGVMAPMP